MNAQLQQLYSSKWENLQTSLKSIDDNKEVELEPANPLLLSVDEENYIAADIKLMFFGQETNSWCEKEEDMNDVISLYDEFFNGEQCWGMSSPFWQSVSKFIEALKLKYPEKNVSTLWNNVYKIGIHEKKGLPTPQIREAERLQFNVIADEIAITKPDIILFLSGPDYDERIREVFPEVKFSPVQGYSERQIAKLQLPGVKFAYRTYHPGYLSRNGIEDYFETILNEISF